MIARFGLAPDIAFHAAALGIDARRSGIIVFDRLVAHPRRHAHPVAAERLSWHQAIGALFRVIGPPWNLDRELWGLDWLLDTALAVVKPRLARRARGEEHAASAIHHGLVGRARR
ncbi:MAG: hypothetical protein ACLPTZ_26140 [Beijerinckiaceae bacterium]